LSLSWFEATSRQGFELAIKLFERLKEMCAHRSLQHVPKNTHRGLTATRISSWNKLVVVTHVLHTPRYCHQPLGRQRTQAVGHRVTNHRPPVADQHNASTDAERAATALSVHILGLHDSVHLAPVQHAMDTHQTSVEVFQ